MKKLLIEIEEDTLKALVEDKALSHNEFTFIADLSGVNDEKVKALYAQRGQLIKDLGKINTELSQLWDKREEK